MSTFVKTIKSFNQDGTSDTIYPVTKADAVYLSDHAEGNVSTAESNINDLNTKVGTASLNTTAQDLSAAINQHEADINELNGNLAYKDFTIDNISIEQGTIGTRGLQTTIDVGLTGYNILSYDIFHVNDSTKAIFQVFRGLGETYPNRIYLNAYRAVAANAVNLSVTIRVYYTKLSMINKN